MTGTYGPQLPTWDDVQDARKASWDALAESGPDSAEAAQVLRLALATHDGYLLAEDRLKDREAGQ